VKTRMISQYVKRVQRDGLISANSSLYCELDEKVVPAIKTAVNHNASSISDIADMSGRVSMYTAIKTYLLHKFVLFLLRGSTQTPKPKSKTKK